MLLSPKARNWMCKALAVLATGWAGAASAQEVSSVGSPVTYPTAPMAGSVDGACQPGLSPNMFGDIVGNRPLSILSLGSSRQISEFIRSTRPGAAANSITQYQVFPAGTANLATGAVNTNFSYRGIGIATPPNPTFTATAPFTSPSTPNIAPLLENPLITNLVRAQLAAPGETVSFNATSRAILEQPRLYDIFLVYDLTTPNVVIAMPNPVDGALVGRTKISTGNNPLPRDRVIFDYDYLNRTPLKVGGQDINRISAGFEKTFFDGLTSVEVRLPFASSINTTSNGFSDGTGTSLGNLHLTFKALVYGSDTLSVSGGLGVSLPTASDTSLRVGGTDFARIENETVLPTPFVAALFTPSERVFSQAWVQYGFDTMGNSVQLNLPNQGLQKIGRLYDPNLLQLDAQLGFWLIDPSTSSSMLRGVAPFVELHYNTTTTKANSASLGAVSVIDARNQYDELNASVGVTTQIGDNIHLTGGVTAPLTQGNNRFGDYQLGLRLNWFFGGRGNPRGAGISNF